jgi:hypothetical protein
LVRLIGKVELPELQCDKNKEKLNRLKGSGEKEGREKANPVNLDSRQ